MKTGIITRILAKDCRRLWPMTLCPIALHAFITGSVFHPGAPILTITLLNQLRWGVIGSIAVVAVLDDPVPGPRGNWTTRPISGLQLLSAKLIFIGLMLALPSAAVAGIVGMVLRARYTATAAAACSLGGVTCLIALGGAVLGSLTGSMLRCIFVSVGLGVFYGYLALNLAAIGRWLAPASIGFGRFPRSVSPDTQFVVSVVGGVVLAIGILVYQYCQRRVGRSTGVLIIGGAMLGLAAAGWPYLWIRSSGARMLKLSAGTAPFSLSLRDDQAELQRVQSRPWPLGDEVQLGFQTRRIVQADHSAGEFLLRGQSRFTADDGRVFMMPRPESFPISGSRAGRGRLIADVFDLLGSKPIPHSAMGGMQNLGMKPIPSQSFNYTLGLLEMPRSSYDALRGTHGQLESWVRFTTYRDELIGLIPMEPAANLKFAGKLWQIRSFFMLPNGVVNVAVEEIDFEGPLPSGLIFPEFALINRTKNEMAYPEVSYGNGIEDSVGVAQNHGYIPSFNKTWSLATRQRTAGLDEAWIRQAQLAVIGRRQGVGPEVYYDWGEVTLPTAPARK
jgi:hypothetical protein